jgi:hypothetical protein
MTGMQEAARTTMAAKLIGDVVAAEHKPVKAELTAMMVDAGVERVRVLDAAGVNLGAVSLARSAPKAKLTDPGAFTAWVAARYPGELMQVVRPAFAAKILDGATAAQAPVDPATGEVVPGVDIAVGEPYVTARPTADARERMRETLLSSGLLQLTGPAEGGEPS